ncbi:growth-regulating factor 10-like [Phragmites australis]|uniref:growth-regulating factor 10-like n=1 Tax=Phragmites australis TaxID=29695 RepID=UPI002D77AFD0|nr:growth-regulating factor 10-like [Phragmites australis]
MNKVSRAFTDKYIHRFTLHLTPALSLLPSSREPAGALSLLPSTYSSKTTGTQHQNLQMAEGKETDSPQPPSKHPRLSCANPNAGEVTMAASLPLVLGLELGLGSSSCGARDVEASSAEATRKRPSVLTFMQQQELEHQVLIYRYFAAGAPVPVHLVLPIWKSVAAASFGTQRFPSLTGLGSLCFDYRSSMEPEPGRCRRTDGKKWRCSRDVVPGHKYCERHVHRGRGRSRKPVEAASAASPAPNAAGNRGAVHSGPSPRGLGFSPTSVLAHSAARAK